MKQVRSSKFSSPSRLKQLKLKSPSRLKQLKLSSPNRLKQLKLTEMLATKDKGDYSRKNEVQKTDEDKCKTVETSKFFKDKYRNEEICTIENDSIRQIPFIDLADSDEDLPEISFTSTSKDKDDTAEDNLKILRADETFISPKYKFDVDQILEERQKQQQVNPEIAEIERELIEGNVLFNDDLSVLKASGLNLDQMLRTDVEQIPSTRRGIDLFDLTKCFEIYSTPVTPNLSVDGHSSRLDKHFRSIISSNNLHEAIEAGFLKKCAKYISTREEILLYIFYLASTCNDEHLGYSCLSTLQTVKHNSSNVYCTWRPSVEDFLTVLLNYGADVNKILPSNFKNRVDFDRLKSKISNSNSNVRQAITNHKLPIGNIRLLLRIMTLYTEDDTGYENEDLFLILYAICCIWTDRLFTNSLLINDFKKLIGAIFDSFMEDYWIENVNRLARSVLKISSNHDDQVFIAHSMPTTSRGVEFQRCFSFFALVKICNVSLGEIVVIRPKYLLSLLRQSPLSNIKDTYVLYSAVKLLDSFVGNDVEKTISWKSLQKLISILREMSSRMKDNVHCLNNTELKNLMVLVASRWTLKEKRIPSSQRTLFNSLSSNLVVENVNSSQNDIVSNDQPKI